MKNKLSLIIIVLLLAGLSALLTFYFDESPFFILWFILTGLVIGIFILSIKSFMIPPAWYFKNRHMIEGGLFFMLMLVFFGFIDSSFSFSSLLLRAIFGFGFGFFVLGYLQKLNFNSLARRIVHDPELIKNEILTDKADFIMKNEKTSGILMLTKEKLSFIPEKKENDIIEIDMITEKPVVNLRKKWFFNSGIVVNDMHFLLSYPRLWMNKINELNNI